MNRVETAQHARVERRCCIQKLLVDLHEVQSLQESPCPSEGPEAVTAHGTNDLDAGQRAGGPLGFATKILAEHLGLRLGDDELHERGGIKVHHRRLALSRPCTAENPARARLAGHGPERGAEIEQIASRRRHAAAEHQTLDMASAVQGDEQGDRATTGGDLHRSTCLDLA